MRTGKYSFTRKALPTIHPNTNPLGWLMRSPRNQWGITSTEMEGKGGRGWGQAPEYFGLEPPLNSHRSTRHNCFISNRRVGGVTWILDDPTLSLTKNLKSENAQSNCPNSRRRRDNMCTFIGSDGVNCSRIRSLLILV